MAQEPTFVEIVSSLMQFLIGAAMKRHSIAYHIEFSNGRGAAGFDASVMNLGFRSPRPLVPPAYIAGYDEAAAELGIPAWNSPRSLSTAQAPS